MRLEVLVTCLWLFCGASLLADGLINKKDDRKFAQELARFGYQDLAMEMAEKISQYDPKSSLKCSLLQVEAQQTFEPEQRANKYQKAIACYEGLLSSYYGLEKLQLQYELGDLLVVRAEELLELTGDDKEPSVINRARELLEKGLNLFQEIKDRTNDAGIDLQPRNDSSQEQERLAKAELRYYSFYGICRAYYFLGLCGSQPHLQKCLSELEDYIWDYEGLAGGYYAMLLQGLVFDEMGKYQDAIDYFNGVYLPLHQLTQEENAKKLAIQATYYKAKTYNDWQKFSQAVEVIQEYRKFFREHFPNQDIETYTFAQAMSLEEAKAYVGQGDYEKALEIAQRIASLKSYWGSIAKNHLLEWGKQRPETLRNAKNAHLIAMGFWSKDQYPQAILAFQKTILYSTTPEEIQKYALDAWEKMGQSFWLLNLYQEAAHTYKIAAQKYQDFGKGELAAKCAYWSYRGYRNNYQITQNEQNQQWASQMRSYLLNNWKDSPYYHNLSFTQAEEAEREAQQTKEVIPAIRNYLAAAKEYRKVSEQADFYERALVSVGKCYFNAARKYSEAKGYWDKNPGSFTMPNKLAGLYQKAISELQRYHRYTQMNPVGEDKQKQARRREAFAQSLFYIGRAYLRLNSYTAGISALDKLRQEYPEQGEMVAAATYIMIRSALDSGAVPKADELAQELEKRYGEDESTSATVAKYKGYSYYLIGKAYSEQADEMREKMVELEENPQENAQEIAEILEEYLRIFGRSVGYLEKWVHQSDVANPVAMEWVGDKLALLGQRLLEKNQAPERARSYVRQAAKLFRQAQRSYQEQQQTAKTESLQLKLAQCAILVENWQKAAELFYPVYREDFLSRKAQREKERGPKGVGKVETQKYSLNYLNNISKILTGLAQETSYQSPEELLPFLFTQANYDLKDNLQEFFHPDLSPQSMFERFLSLKERIAWITGGIFEAEDQRKLEERFTKEQQERKGLTREQREEKDIRRLQFVYRDRYLDLINQAFPVNTKIAAENVNNIERQIRRLSLFLAYEFTSELVDRLPRYQNPQINFGYYDNEIWWEAKHRQIFLVYLQGDKVTARNLIESLQAQQSKMGGSKYQAKFERLLRKAEE